MIAGGTESAIHPITLASFSSMQALSRRNDDPAHASRPYSVDRDGFVMGEGAASLVLETEEHALARGARIYAELAGGGVTADSYHITAHDPEGRGASRAVQLALEQAGASPDDVTHINAHATSTPVGDPSEYVALREVFGDRIHDHPRLGDEGVDRSPARRHRRARGRVHASSRCATARRRRRSTSPSRTRRSRCRSRASRSRWATARSWSISNSFGFGGHNAVAAFRSY